MLDLGVSENLLIPKRFVNQCLSTIGNSIEIALSGACVYACVCVSKYMNGFDVLECGVCIVIVARPQKEVPQTTIFLWPFLFVYYSCVLKDFSHYMNQMFCSSDPKKCTCIY